MFTMDDLLEVAVKMEKNGEAVYRKSLKKIRQKALTDLLSWMAAEEAAHSRWFLEQKKRLALQPEEKALKEMIPEVLQDMMGENALSLDEVEFDKISTPLELLNTFIEFEKETIQFYELLDMFIETEEVRKGLKTIIQEENAHVEKLANMAAALR
ncbi:MAG: ferritin family protein [Desulfobacula sp.]|nr:ferritin family protein [Desulfobacula sp.]